MACCGTLANRPQLPCNNLRLPFRIKGHRQDRSALITKKLEYRNCSFRNLVTGSKCFNDDIDTASHFGHLEFMLVSEVGTENSLGASHPRAHCSAISMHRYVNGRPTRARPRARPLTCQRQVVSGGFDSAGCRWPSGDCHWREPAGVVCGGEAVLKAGASV
jgi:hypothetical protein